MVNPYKFEFVHGMIEQQETQRLEFKSSRELLNENSQKRGKFISEQIVPTVSAFLNTDGGQLVIGIEEKNGVAVALSPGISRTRVSWEQLQSAICDRIQPAVAGYISVYSVHVGTSPDGERLFAFVVDVKPGNTAYQADDKKYYVRRAGQSEAMEDKDIRLRMLAGDKPRFVISLHSNIVPRTGIMSNYVQCVTWALCFENVGVRNIPRAVVRSNLNLGGLSDDGLLTVRSCTREYQETTFPIEGVEATALLPGQRFEMRLITVSPLVFPERADPAAISMTADVIAYVDDGVPCELTNYDLMADLRPIIDSKWMVSAN
jgi:hypothetical protein